MWERLTGPTGAYRLCWCRGTASGTVDGDSTCGTPEGFVVDVGELVMLGTERMQPGTCVAGQTCVLKTIGIPGDRYMILDTCGVTDSNVATPVRGTSQWNQVNFTDALTTARGGTSALQQVEGTLAQPVGQ